MADATRTSDPRGRFATALLLAFWLGLCAGLGELALLAAAKYGLGRFIQVNPQILWMAPLAYAAMFVILAVPLSALARDRAAAIRLVAASSLFAGSLGALFLIQGLHKGAAVLVAAGVAIQGSRLVAAHATPASRLVRATVLPL